MKRTFTTFMCSLVFLFGLITVQVESQTSVPDDIYWADGFGPEGILQGTVSGKVNAMVWFEGKLIIGGKFNKAGGVTVSNIAAWDGSTWTKLPNSWSWGSPDGLLEEVNALIVYKGELIAAVSPRLADDPNPIRVWKPQQQQWERLGLSINNGGISGNGYALAQRRGLLYLGGWVFTDRGPNRESVGLLQWNGSSWSSLPGLTESSNLQVYVYSLNYTFDRLYVGGIFDSAGTQAAHNIVTWSFDAPTSLTGHWQTMGQSPLIASVKAISALVRFGVKIYVGTDAGEVYEWHWITNTPPVGTWTHLGDVGAAQGELRGHVYALAHDGDYLYAGGEFSGAPGVSAHSLARWDGLIWEEIGSTVLSSGDYVLSLLLQSGDLYVGGDFGKIGDVPARGLARRSNDVWELVADKGVNGGLIRELEVNGGALYAAGRFTSAGKIGTNGLASFDGAEWSDLFSHAISGDDVRCFGVHNNEMYIGGKFSDLNIEQTVHFVLRWTGSFWAFVGPADRDTVQFRETRAVSSYGGKLVTGGIYFPVSRLFGVNWWQMGTGAPDGANALLSYNGALIAGGGFNMPDGSYGIASGGPTGLWTSLGTGLGGAGAIQIRDMIEYRNELVVGGLFNAIDGVTAKNIAKWDGSNWSALPGRYSGLPGGGVYALEIYGDQLITGGDFEFTQNSEAINNVAAWDGVRWSALGSGTDFGVVALATLGSSLYVGGGFNMAGGKPASGFARWDKVVTICCDLAGDANGDGRVNIADVSFVIAWLFSAGPTPVCCARAGANGDDQLNIADVSYVIAWLFAAGPDPICAPAGMGC